ncbi:MAG: isoprenoid biosynthesis glyoxalase ElbB [Proteobacteria bacterium]|nr:isoprenoid biosynthesis glyoxalase ElbB [Pseudomonadota bacterium]
MGTQRQVGVVLAGCGFRDGAEVQEAVLTLYFLERQGLVARCFAPDRSQTRVINHLTGQAMQEERNVLVEAARIARGQIAPLASATMRALDALVLPGGYGVAQTLSDLADSGAQATVDGDLARLVGEAVEARKPIVAICISPAVVAAALRPMDRHARLTIGDDAATAAVIRRLGATHETCAVEQIVVDQTLRIISTPAYMLGPGPRAVGAGIEAAIDQLARWLA